MVAAARALDAQAVGNGLYGLQSMGSDAVEVQRLLEVLAAKLAAFRGKLTEQDGRGRGKGRDTCRWGCRRGCDVERASW